MISGLVRPDSGAVEFRGKRISGLPPHKIAALGIGRTFQIVRPLMDLTLLDNVTVAVLYGREAIGDIRTARERGLALLEFAGLAEKADRLPGQLALEDRKRLEVARALGSKPEVLLLDEVFAGLNAREIDSAVEFTFRIRDEHNMTIFMIEHVMKAILAACDRVTALHYGMKIADGTPEEVANHPEVIQAYLGTQHAGN